MSKTNDDLMFELLRARRDGTKVSFRPKDQPDCTPITVKDDHAWNLADNDYTIRHRREYIIRIDKRDPFNPVIQETANNWTRSDFGRDDMGEHILMREVYQDEM